jgi:serpin B
MKLPILPVAGLLVIGSPPAAFSSEVRLDLLMGNDHALHAVDLYHELGDSEGNVFFSPHSVSSAMAMVYEGANNNTATEIATAMRFLKDKQDFRNVFSGLNGKLDQRGNDQNNVLTFANALCLTGGNPSDAYKRLLGKHYDAEIFNGDVAAINSWVHKKTEGKIDKVLESLSPNSLCVLLNAVYFKGTWQIQFNESDTRDQDFHLGADNKVKVPMMRQTGSFKLYENANFSMLEMPYSSGLSMQVYLPARVDGMAEFENSLNGQDLVQWMSGNQGRPVMPGKVAVSMPKFKFETSYDLVAPMKEL